MQRIMIVSDTHRRHGNLAEAIYNEGHLDMLIHLGDVEGEEEVIKSIAGCETIFIAGTGHSNVWYPRSRVHAYYFYLLF